jgi:hypothetical protein
MVQSPFPVPPTLDQNQMHVWWISVMAYLLLATYIYIWYGMYIRFSQTL